MLIRSLVVILILNMIGGCMSPSISPEIPPNIIVMLVDDAGYADFGFMGSEDLKTPNLDRLANGGIVFTDAHVTASVCAPSRAGLLTGQYQQRFGFECNALTAFQGIDTSIMTIAEAIKTAGYKTAAFGKWHVGDLEEARPHNRGFDYSWTFLSGARSYFSNPVEDVRGHTKSIRENDQFTTFDGYLTDVLGEKAVDFIDRNMKDPFFMYWSPNAVHTPMEATAEDLALFADHPRQELAAMTWALDKAVGRIVDKLEKEKLLDNTLIFFLSDNGGAANNQSSNLPLKGFKGNKYEGGQRVPFFIHWPAQVQAGLTFQGLTSALDIFPTCLDVTGAKLSQEILLDGTSLVPFIKEEVRGNPHHSLFWRKEGMAASRSDKFKLIQVDSLGIRLYDLNKDIGELNDISLVNSAQSRDMEQEFSSWEEEMMSPLWVESHVWNEVTWWIHKDLFFNKPVSVKSPEDLREIKGEN